MNPYKAYIEFKVTEDQYDYLRHLFTDTGYSLLATSEHGGLPEYLFRIGILHTREYHDYGIGSGVVYVIETQIPIEARFMTHGEHYYIFMPLE